MIFNRFKSLPSTKCFCGQKVIDAGVDKISWYWTNHGRMECTLQLPDNKCWCGLKRSEHIEGHNPEAVEKFPDDKCWCGFKRSEHIEGHNPEVVKILNMYLNNRY